MTTIYLSLSTQVAKSTFFMKSPVCLKYKCPVFEFPSHPVEASKYLAAHVQFLLNSIELASFYIQFALGKTHTKK